MNGIIKSHSSVIYHMKHGTNIKAINLFYPFVHQSLDVDFNLKLSCWTYQSVIQNVYKIKSMISLVNGDINVMILFNNIFGSSLQHNISHFPFFIALTASKCDL